MHLTAPKRAESVAPSTAIIPSIPAPAASAAAAAQLVNPLSKFSAKIVSITDGDTVDVLAPGNLTYAVRLAGIDAPEHDQAFGAQSTQHLSELISGKTVSLDCENERSYGRLICKILLPDGEDADLDQVKAGMAWHYKQYEDEQSTADRQAYAAAECAAMKSKIGLWSDPHPRSKKNRGIANSLLQRLGLYHHNITVNTSILKRFTGGDKVRTAQRN